MTHRSPADDDVVWGGEGRVRGRGRRSTRNGAWPAGVASRMGRGRRDRRPGHALCDLRRRCGDQPPMASVHQFRPQPALDSLATDTTSVVTTRVSHELVVFCCFFWCIHHSCIIPLGAGTPVAFYWMDVSIRKCFFNASNFS